MQSLKLRFGCERANLKFLMAILFLGFWQTASTARQNPRYGLTHTLDKVVSFAVQQELKASHLEHRKDVCVGFALDVGIDEKEVFKAFRASRLGVHKDGWCNNGPRGITILVISPVREIVPDQYAVVIDVSDSEPIRREGAHFATLLRRGTYTIKLTTETVPEVVSYLQSCCPTPEQPSGAKAQPSVGTYAGAEAPAS